MTNKDQFFVKDPSPIILGTGLVALDILISGNKPYRKWIGGSCGNVITILAYLGWESYPIVPLGKDKASDIILKDMKKWNVLTKFIQNNIEFSTPIVIERIFSNGSTSAHEFRFKCPKCGSFLPRNRPIRKELVNSIIKKTPIGQVFYFDRVSIAALEFAKDQRSKGGIIVFEPHKFSKRKLFKECLQVAHIVKYSYEELETNFFGINIPLEIQTVGAEGLRYRYQKLHTEWQKIPAFHIPELVDSAGAGDWCTAGIIHMLGQNGQKGLLKVTRKNIENSLRFGQALSALGCKYEGARGLMYSLSKNEVKLHVSMLLDGKKANKLEFKNNPEIKLQLFEDLCPSCNSTKSKIVK